MKPSTLFLVIFLLACTTLAQAGEYDHVVLNRAEHIDIHSKEIDELWRFVRHITNTQPDLPPPQIYFVTSDPARMDPEWSAWLNGWIKEVGFDGYPWGETYDASFYTGTTIIQVDPNLFLLDRFFYEDSRRKARNEAKEIIAHEMLHYIFENKGLFSSRYIHHCVMYKALYEQQIREYIERTPITHTASSLCQGISPDLIGNEIIQSRQSRIVFEH